MTKTILSYFKPLYTMFKKSIFLLVLSFVIIYALNDISPILKSFQHIWFLREISDIVLSSSLKIIVFIISGALINNLIKHLIWEVIFLRNPKATIPKLLQQTLSVIVYFIAFIASLNIVLGLKLSDIITTSGFIGIVIGFAMRPIMTDFFAGIALNLEGSFLIGEWVLVNQKGIQSHVLGSVKEITWRSTLITTPENSTVIIPNSELIMSRVTNLSRPSPMSEFEINLSVDYSTDLDLVQKVLNAALCEAVANHGPLQYPEPKARIKNIDSSGVCFKITFMVDPLEASKGKARHIIYRSIVKHFQMCGLMPSVSRQEIVIGNIPCERNYDYKSLEHKKQIIRQIDFFSNSTDEELSLIAEHLIVHEPESVDTVILKGDTGDSMYVVVIGSLEVFINNTDEPPNKVATINPGDVFGEMSLLTGAPRSATIKCSVASVLYEIKKDIVAELFKLRPELMDTLAQVCVERKFKNEKKVSVKIMEEKTTFFDKVSEGISAFFRRS